MLRYYGLLCKYEICGKELTEKEEEKEKLPSGVVDALLEAESTLLAEKLRMMYEKEYQLFKKWKNIKSINCLSKNVLLAHFSEKSKKVKPSLLWSYYSMLKRGLLANENCNISKFCYLLATLIKYLSEGYKAKWSKILRPDGTIKFLAQAFDDVYLFVKVIAIFGVHEATTSDELHK